MDGGIWFELTEPELLPDAMKLLPGGLLTFLPYLLPMVKFTRGTSNNDYSSVSVTLSEEFSPVDITLVMSYTTSSLSAKPYSLHISKTALSWNGERVSSTVGIWYFFGSDEIEGELTRIYAKWYGAQGLDADWVHE